MTWVRSRQGMATLVVLVILVLYPQVMPRFWVLSIASNAMILGIAALSLVFMAGYGGMTSLAQAALAGFAAYMVALLSLVPSTNATGSALGAGLPAIPSALIAIVLATALGALFGAISSRSYGIYFLMLTLALAVGFYYIVLQNYDIFGGHIGFAGIEGPTGQPREDPPVFYYLVLATAASVYLGLRYLVRSQLGLTFQGVRDNPRRMAALGYRVGAHRVALFAIGGFVAGISGVLGAWYRGNISPGIVDLNRTIEVLIVAVIGGLGYPIGAFVGAIIYTLIKVFASSLTIGGFRFDERFNTLIGLGFVVIVLVAPNGVVGLADRAWQAMTHRSGARRRAVDPLAAEAGLVPAPALVSETQDAPAAAAGDDIPSAS
ncbi:MAG: branched-chain amino acid ABC transporter permease [Chloroflexota bacterium]